MSLVCRCIQNIRCHWYVDVYKILDVSGNILTEKINHISASAVNHALVKPKTVKLVFAASLQSTQD